mmetsp:Transcript_36537/g.102082  ORF Transcript_36537/g.102082 Transcript_36537/m.102082 type:complete len:219 (-) Transcript_36537:94-750(-)
MSTDSLWVYYLLDSRSPLAIPCPELLLSSTPFHISVILDRPTCSSSLCYAYDINSTGLQDVFVDLRTKLLPSAEPFVQNFDQSLPRNWQKPSLFGKVFLHSRVYYGDFFLHYFSVGFFVQCSDEGGLGDVNGDIPVANLTADLRDIRKERVETLKFSFDHPSKISICACLADSIRFCDLFLEERRNFSTTVFYALREKVTVLHLHNTSSILLICGFSF